jgi:hypothetical protein
MGKAFSASGDWTPESPPALLVTYCWRMSLQEISVDPCVVFGRDEPVRHGKVKSSSLRSRGLVLRWRILGDLGDMGSH